MSEWRNETLGGNVEHRKGFAFKSRDLQDEGHPVIRVSNFTARSIDMSQCGFLNRSLVSDHECVALKEGDVVIATVGSWPSNPASVVGKTVVVPSEAHGALLNQNAVRLRAKETMDQRFLFYRLKTAEFQAFLINTAQGSASQASIKLSDIFAFPFGLPPLEEQRAIAAILGALDDKIELNRKTAATLEEMARALFRSWFVDFDPVHAKAAGQPPAHMDAATAALFPHRFGDDGLPEGWKSCVLGDFARNAKAQVNPDNIDLETPYIGLEHMPRRSVRINNWDKAEKVSSAKMRMKEGQFLFGKLRPYFHKVGMVPVDGICSTDILVIEAKKHHWCEFVLCVISSEELVEHANSSSTGTRMPRAKWSDLAAFEIAVPNDALLSAFSDITSCWYDRIHNSIFESQTLAALRDTLLPKLMSGELRVGEAREQVEEAV